MITAELAKKIATAKFVCILLSGPSSDAIPTFAQSRRYIDFRDDSEFEVRLEELLRTLHKAPADPEPPLGKNPFAKESQLSDEIVRYHDNQTNETDNSAGEELARKAAILLSYKDMLGWKRLLRKTRSGVEPNLQAWRERIQNETITEDKWPAFFNEGVEVCEPLLILALTAVDSEIDSIRDQRALIDDFINMEDWNRSGSTVVVSMPYALAFVYHYVLGAFLVGGNKHNEAIHLLSMKVSDPRQNRARKLWQIHGLMGWVRSLEGGHCLRSWEYLGRIYESRPWPKQFFHTQKYFTDSLCAYTMIASMIELGSFLAEYNTQEPLKTDMELDVPPLFAIDPVSRLETDIEVIVNKAMPNRSIVNDIATAVGTDTEIIYNAWPSWFEQWDSFLGRIGGYQYSLADYLSDHKQQPPELPK
ncbi:MAG: hypothetical protein KAY37_06855 [Phycisphaerae bacterium]|nr:hypothetical protein [Phycisphaerae bacterium]